MSILPVGGVDAAGFVPGLPGLENLAAAGGVGVAGTTPSLALASGVTGSDQSFAATIAGSIDQLQALQSQSSALAVQAVTGDLDDIHDYTIAATQASVALELTAALRNKAVDAFTEIMRMQA